MFLKPANSDTEFDIKKKSPKIIICKFFSFQNASGKNQPPTPSPSGLSAKNAIFDVLP